MTFLPGVPKLMTHLVLSFSRTGRRVFISFALVPGGPLMGAKMCSWEPLTGVVSTKPPENSTFPFNPYLIQVSNTVLRNSVGRGVVWNYYF